MSDVYNEHILLEYKKALNAEKFTSKAASVHNNKYDYSRVIYVDSYTKVCIVCPEHGEFWQLPGNHLQGNGCPECYKSKSTLNTTGFIKKAKIIHGDKYNYKKTIYVSSFVKVCITCPKHGDFWQLPGNHLQGNGCPECFKAKITCSKEDFINKAKKIYGSTYDYTKVNYTGALNKVCIFCPKHGEFWQTPNNHLSGHGCPECGRTHNRKQ